LLLQT
jgi:hypothetical protein